MDITDKDNMHGDAAAVRSKVINQLVQRIYDAMQPFIEAQTDRYLKYVKENPSGRSADAWSVVVDRAAQALQSEADISTSNNEKFLVQREQILAKRDQLYRLAAKTATIEQLVNGRYLAFCRNGAPGYFSRFLDEESADINVSASESIDLEIALALREKFVKEIRACDGEEQQRIDAVKKMLKQAGCALPARDSHVMANTLKLARFYTEQWLQTHAQAWRSEIDTLLEQTVAQNWHDANTQLVDDLLSNRLQQSYVQSQIDDPTTNVVGMTQAGIWAQATRARREERNTFILRARWKPADEVNLVGGGVVRGDIWLTRDRDINEEVLAKAGVSAENVGRSLDGEIAVWGEGQKHLKQLCKSAVRES